jgi:hypothetical protein
MIHVSDIRRRPRQSPLPCSPFTTISHRSTLLVFSHIPKTSTKTAVHFFLHRQRYRSPLKMSITAEPSTADDYPENVCAFFQLSCLSNYTTGADALCYKCCHNHASSHLESIANAGDSAADRARRTDILETSLTKHESTKLKFKNYLC